MCPKAKTARLRLLWVVGRAARLRGGGDWVVGRSVFWFAVRPRLKLLVEVPSFVSKQWILCGYVRRLIG